MRKYTIPQLVNLLGMPVLTVVLGLILLFSPDTASALVGKILAWLCILAGVALGAGALSRHSAGQRTQILLAVVCLLVGLWMLMNPLVLAKFLGRILGVFILIRGIRSIPQGYAKPEKFLRAPGVGIACVTTLLGLVLILIPMTTSRLLFTIVGIVMIGVGVAQGFDRLRAKKMLDEGDDPNIIDVEKL